MNPAVRTFHRLSDLVRAIERGIDSFDLLSFDVFDTLVIRRVHDPDRLKLATARYIERRAHASGIEGWPAVRVQRLRDRVERVHRRRQGVSGPDHEACYPRFMADVLRIIFGERADAALLDEVTRHELDIESAMLVARSQFPPLLQRLKMAGKRVMAVTDMYLPAESVRLLLDRAGYAGLVDDVYSSADTGRAKASGAAWSTLGERWNIEPARWWHVGDHPISDGSRPASMGITTRILRDHGELQRRQQSANLAAVSVKRPFWRGRLAQQWMLPLEGENGPQPALYRMGYSFFGPLLCTFIQGLAERCFRRDIRQVFFFSREGRILLDLWNTMVPVLFAGARIPEARYLHVSRRALAAAAYAHRDLDFENARMAFLPASNRDFSDFCRVFGLDPHSFAPALARHGLAADDPLSKWHDGWRAANTERFQAFLRDRYVQDEIRRQQAPAQAALHRYLESLDFFRHREVVVADIGWLGTIQRLLDHAIGHRPDAPALNGFLFATSPGYPFPEHPRNRLEGVFFDHHRFDFAGSLVLTARDLFEEATRADEPALAAYDESGPAAPLRFQADPDGRERAQSAYFAPLQQGIRDAARRHGPAMAVLGYSADEWKPWLNAMLIDQLAFPTADEMAVLRYRHHADDLAHGRPAPRARRALRRLWAEPDWKCRFVPLLRTAYYLRHALYCLKQ